MKALVFVFSLMVSGSVFASGLLPALSFKSVDCVLKKDEVLVQEFHQALMVLQIDDGTGRFAQVRLQDGETNIQYQVLIEDDLKNKGAVIVLQNLMVGELESSTEFSSYNPSWIKARQLAYAVECTLNKDAKVKPDAKANNDNI